MSFSASIARRLLRRSTLAPALQARTRATAAPKDDGLGVGNYEQPPFVSAQVRPQGEKLYDDWQDRRNLNEKLHEEDDILTVWGVDDKPHLTKWQALRQLSGVLLFLFGVYQVAKLWNSPARRPSERRTLPRYDSNGKDMYEWAK
eukprot:Colp12_sorted_trinity150504_noHs@14206